MARKGGNRRAGDRGEELAYRYLAAKGYELLGRNYRTKRGEIDLILRDGDTLVFVEVKLRRGTGFGDPLEAVTPRKRERVRLAAERYLAENEELCTSLDGVRFDAVGVLVGAGGPEVRHVEGAF